MPKPHVKTKLKGIMKHCKKCEHSSGKLKSFRCGKFNMPISINHAAHCKGYSPKVDEKKIKRVKCSDCKSLSYGYYCEKLKKAAPYVTKSKQCAGFESILTV